MRDLVRKILDELKWHSKQNDKIIDLLGKLRKPCGQQPNANMMKLFESLPNGVAANPKFAPFFEHMKEVLKNGQ